MAWTNPKTWATGAIVLFSELNTHVRDALRYLKGMDGVPTIQSGLIIDNSLGTEYLRVPSLTTTQRDALTPAAGMIIYNSTLTVFQRYEAGAWVSYTDLAKMTIASIAQGDIFFRGASVVERLGAGTSGYFLKTQGAAANPIWALPGGLLYGLAADRPAAGIQGREYWATDTKIKSYDTGSAWVDLPFLNTLAQAITGIKTFGSIPILPASDPTLSEEATRKAYVDKFAFHDLDGSAMTPGLAGVWVDWDLSASIPAGSKAVFILCHLGGLSTNVHARKNGSARFIPLGSGGATISWIVELDAGRIIEVYKSNAGAVLFFAMGYWGP